MKCQAAVVIVPGWSVGIRRLSSQVVHISCKWIDLYRTTCWRRKPRKTRCQKWKWEVIFEHESYSAKGTTSSLSLSWTEQQPAWWTSTGRSQSGTGITWQTGRARTGALQKIEKLFCLTNSWRQKLRVRALGPVLFSPWWPSERLSKGAAGHINKNTFKSDLPKSFEWNYQLFHTILSQRLSITKQPIPMMMMMLTIYFWIHRFPNHWLDVFPIAQAAAHSIRTLF